MSHQAVHLLPAARNGSSTTPHETPAFDDVTMCSCKSSSLAHSDVIWKQVLSSVAVECQHSAILVQAVSATILGNLASSGDEDFKKAFAEAGGLEKLRELCKSGSLASAPVRKAAASALADITKGVKPYTYVDLSGNRLKQQNAQKMRMSAHHGSLELHATIVRARSLNDATYPIEHRCGQKHRAISVNHGNM